MVKVKERLITSPGQKINADQAKTYHFRLRFIRVAGAALPAQLLLLAAVMMIVTTTAACRVQSEAQRKTEATTTAATPLSPIKNLTAQLEDEVRDLDAKRIRWSTYWKLCWEPYPRAVGYELQTSTAEGASPKLKRQNDNCFRLEVAAGENEKSAGLFNREQLVSLQKGQLSYRVRAVLSNDERSEWSPIIHLGQTINAR